MSQEHIAIFMFASMMLMLFTGQRVFGAIGAIAAIAALALATIVGPQPQPSDLSKRLRW